MGIVTSTFLRRKPGRMQRMNVWRKRLDVKKFCDMQIFTNNESLGPLGLHPLCRGASVRSRTGWRPSLAGRSERLRKPWGLGLVWWSTLELHQLGRGWTKQPSWPQWRLCSNLSRLWQKMEWLPLQLRDNICLQERFDGGEQQPYRYWQATIDHVMSYQQELSFHFSLLIT